MPGQFLHGVPAIVAKLLWANRGLGADPAPWRAFTFGKGTKPTTSWPVFHGLEPSEPDAVLTVYQTASDLGPRVVTGEQTQRYGFTVRVRGQDYNAVHAKAEAIRFDFERDGRCTDQVVTLDAQQYLIPCVSRVMLVPLPRVTPPQGIGMWLVNLNCLAPILPYPVQG